MKKIGLFLSADSSYGGTFQYCLSMLKSVASFPPNDFEVLVVYTNPIWDDIIQKYNIKAVKVLDNASWLSKVLRKVVLKIKLPTIIRRKYFSLIESVAKTLVKQKCDLWIFPAQDGYSYMVDVPSLGTIHDLMHRYEPRFPEVSEHGIYKSREILYKNMCKWTKGILVDSEVGRQQVHDSYGLSLNKIFPLPYIPPQYIYEYKNEHPQDFDKKYNLPDKFIFYPAQFWKHKNHAGLIKAAALLKKDIKDLKLLFVGYKNNGYEESRNLVRELDLEENIIFIDYIPERDITEFYHRARAMIMPTFFGPTNIPPLEAFVVGCPVAVSNIYGMPQQVKDAAILFNPNSIEEIANSIKRLWTEDNLCHELVARGYKRSQEWGQEQFRDRLIDIINTILNSDNNLD